MTQIKTDTVAGVCLFYIHMVRIDFYIQIPYGRNIKVSAYGI